MIEKSNSTSLALATIAILGQPPRFISDVPRIVLDALCRVVAHDWLVSVTCGKGFVSWIGSGLQFGKAR